MHPAEGAPKSHLLVGVTYGTAQKRCSGKTLVETDKSFGDFHSLLLGIPVFHVSQSSTLKS